MNTLWSLSGIKLACAHCKMALEHAGLHLICSACGLRYPLTEGLANMRMDCLQGVEGADSAHASEAAHKSAVQGVYDSINRTLEKKGISRFSTFINWGYVASDKAGSSGFQGVNESFVHLLREIVGTMSLGGKDVLEVGCGRGGNVNELCKNYGASSVVGIDLTSSNIEFCHKNNRYKQAYYCIGDAEELPIQSGCCDYVLNVESSHLYPRIERFFYESHRVLKPEGALLYADIMNASDVAHYDELWEKLGFFKALDRDITGNVLLSGEQSLSTRMSTLGGSFEGNVGTLEWLEAPGTQNHQDMKTGKRVFKIIHLIKKEWSTELSGIERGIKR